MFNTQEYFDKFRTLMDQNNIFQNMKNAQSFDFNAFNNLHEQNLATLFNVSQIASTSAQEIGGKTASFINSNINQMINATKEIFTTQDAEQISAKQREYLKSSTEALLNHTQNISNILIENSANMLDAMSVNKCKKNSCSTKNPNNQK